MVMNRAGLGRTNTARPKCLRVGRLTGLAQRDEHLPQPDPLGSYLAPGRSTLTKRKKPGSEGAVT
jgi:hypothetical protein